MGPLTFNSQLYPHLKQTWSFSLLPPSSSPAYALSQNLKPRLMPSHGWLTLTTDMLDIHMLLDMLPTHTLVYTELDTTVTLLDTDTWEREADSEAKPWLAYSNYGYAGYPYASTYGAYAYPSVYRHAAYAAPAYTTYGAAHLIGKRSAYSEPESWYGAYGYASPYTYGGYGSYGYSAYRPYTYGRVYGAYNGYY